LMGRRCTTMSEESLFELALNTPEAGRAALLDRECAGDPALRARLDALLAAHFVPNSPLDLPAAAPAGRTPSLGPPPRLARPPARPAGDREPRPGGRGRGGGGRRAVQAAPADRRGRDGLGLDGRPDRAGQAPRRGQADPHRPGAVADDPVAVRGRAAGDRPD